MCFYEDQHLQCNCMECTDLEKTLNDVGHWFEGVLDLAYSKEKLDANELERCLEEMAFYLGKKIPENEMQLVRRDKEDKWDKKVTQIDVVLDQWKDLNNNYLKQINNK